MMIPTASQKSFYPKLLAEKILELEFLLISIVNTDLVSFI